MGYKYKIILIIFISFLAWLPIQSKAAELSISPETGNFKVGDVFDVKIILNTIGDEVNAISIDLSFPPEKLQLVSPSVGQSIVAVWISQPEFSNVSGIVKLEGGIPGGIYTEKGVVANLKFRVKESGKAFIKIHDSSRVLLNDGLGTNVLSDSSNASYNFNLPAPQGPVVYSDTHPDQEVWYSPDSVSLNWSGDYDGVSYVLSSEPIDVPDNVPETKENSVIYRDIVDGNHYFHIKGIKNGVWGGVTHYALNIDNTPPAEFGIEIAPSRRTSSLQPVISFLTSDNYSGIDRYEIKIVPLFLTTQEEETGLFTEATSPYLYKADYPGDYDVIVRAYDEAGNVREITDSFKIVDSVFNVSDKDGLVLGNKIISWPFIYGLLIGILILLIVALGRPDKLYIKIKSLFDRKAEVNNVDVNQKLEELRRYKEKYGHLVLILSFMASAFIFSFSTVMASSHMGLNPPQIETISRNINNNEIFYIGGYTADPDTEIVIYLQNIETGETYNFQTVSDYRREWFYRHNNFLPSGNYIIWVQAEDDNITSPPSSQFELNVSKNAVTFGGSRLSYGAIYGIIFSILILIILALISYLIYLLRQEHQKHQAIGREVQEAEEALRYGFALIKKDIEREVSNLASRDGELSTEEKRRKDELLEDLKEIEMKIGKEILDLERFAH